MPDEHRLSYWAPPSSLVRVREGREEVMDRVIHELPDTPPKLIDGDPSPFDVETLCDHLAPLAGRELPLGSLVEGLSDALVNAGWLGPGMHQLAVDLSQHVVEGPT